MAKKFSQFPSASSISPGDSVVGLKDGANTRFSFATFLSAIQSLFVPTSRKVNNKALTTDITLNASDVGAVDTNDVGVADGVASLDSTGKVPSSQLPTIPSDAEDITYDPTTSGLTATDVQEAIDEVVTDLDDKQSTITASGILKGDGQGGVSAATAGTDYQAPLTIDATPTANSTNPVQSGGVYTDVRTRVPNYGKGVNLLRNWYFVGGGTGHGVFPVNQRGATSGATTNNTYSIDGWKWTYGSSPGSWSLVSGGISVSPSSGSDYVILFQELGNLDSLLNGKNVTASVLFSDGQFASGSITRNSGTSQVFASIGGTWVLAMVNNSLRLRFGTARTMVAVKLELGTEQTLAHLEGSTWVLNEIPDYEYELYRCITSTADPSDTYANKSLATEQQLAYVETGTTASRAYAVGEYFCWNGLLYRAKTAISSGGTFTPETNCKQVTVGGFNALKAQTLVRRQTLATSITTGLNEWDVAADAVSGYKPIGIVGVQFAALPRSAVTISQFLLDNGTDINVAAQSTRARTSGIAVNAFVLYAKE